jgi:endonuclease G
MMADPSGKQERQSPSEDLARPSDEAIDAFLDGEGFRWMRVPNIIGIEVGEKSRKGQPAGILAVVFEVAVKLDASAEIARAASRIIPAEIEIGGVSLPTDVIEAWPEAHPTNTGQGRCDPVSGGIAIGNHSTSGTLGAIVWDPGGRRALALSNWHVLANQGSDGRIYQPKYEPTRPSENLLGRLAGPRALDRNVDAALATIEGRGVAGEVTGLSVRITAVRKPEIGMRVIKCGMATGITHGQVKIARKIVAMDLAGMPVPHSIAVCTIGQSPEHPDERLSAPGDSGACWMLSNAEGESTGIMVGLHVGGDGPGKAYACHAPAVFAALGIEPLPDTWSVGPTILAPFGALAGVDVDGRAPGTRHRVIARDGLTLRGGPGTDFSALATCRYGEEVLSIGRRGEWLMIDLQGDGKCDGFMLESLLEAAR